MYEFQFIMKYTTLNKHKFILTLQVFEKILHQVLQVRSRRRNMFYLVALNYSDTCGSVLTAMSDQSVH